MKKTTNRLASSPRFKGVKYISHFLRIFEIPKHKINMDTPTYDEESILDLHKI